MINLQSKKFAIIFFIIAVLITSGIASVHAQTVTELKTKLADLSALLETLQVGSSYVWTRNLQFGSRGEDIRQLQIYLNANGATVATSGAGSRGLETTYFGPLTKSALIRWQTANGISPALGYLGPITRSKIAFLSSVVTPSVYPEGCVSSSGFSPTTGQSCSTNLPPGCASSAGFSTMTGEPCTTPITTSATTTP